MSKSDTPVVATGGGIGFSGLLTVVFITLKLIGFFPWSWWWVFVPVWGPFALVALCLLVGCLAMGLWFLICGGISLFTKSKSE